MDAISTKIMIETAVVILNYNGKHFLTQFLPSVIQHTPDAEIIVADNASTDDSLPFLAQNFPQIRVIKMSQNTGFAGGYNIALQEVKAKYYVLLNSDAEVTTNWLSPLIQVMEKDTKVAAVQPKILAFYDKNCFEYAGAGGGFIDRFGFPFCRGRIFDHAEKNYGQYDDTCLIFWAVGACVAVRADLYHQFGGLDNDFFAHMEEIDWCWRLKNAGYQIMYTGKSTVFHVGGGTLPQNSTQKTYFNFRNNLVMMIKNLPSNQVLGRVFFRMLLDGIAAVMYLFSGKFNLFWAVIRAHFYLYANFSKIIKKRKNAQKTASCFRHPEIYQGSIVWDYFIRKKHKFSDLDI